MISTSVELNVAFHDVDAMEIAWHGHYVKYLEIARCALLDQIDYNYPQMKASGYGWPVIDLHIRYARPCLFNQRIKVTATLVEWENRLKIDYLITDAASGKRLTKGHTIQVAVDMSTGEMCFASPDCLLNRIEPLL